MIRLALLAALCVCTAVQAGAPPAALTAKLRRGVNLSHWWWQPSDHERGRIEKVVDEEDVRLIKAAGLTHVRIPIDPSLFVSDKQALKDANVKSLASAVKMFNDAGIAAVLDVHTRGSESKKMLPADNPTGWSDELEKFWDVFAPVWKQASPDLLVVELLNEPNGIKEPQRWAQIQEKLLKKVRSHLPRHTIILTGDDWGSIDALVKLLKPTDSNVIYSFHFYEPHTFTHQGATWGSPMWKSIKNLKYPFDQQSADAASSAAADSSAARSIGWYAKDRWGAEKIRSRFEKAKAWADEHKATLYLGEFGAYRAGCDENSRSAWMSDVRTAAEASGIGWCVWDYAGGFSITDSDKKPGKPQRTLNAAAANALGLTPPAPRKRP